MNRAFIFVFLATVFFSTMEVALKGMVGNFGTMQVNITRFLVGGLALLPFALRGIRKSGDRLDASALGRMALLGLLGIAVSMTLYQIAVETAPANVVAVIFCSNTAFVLLFAFLILHTPITRNQVLALVLVCLGLACIVNPFETRIPLQGLAFALAAPLCFAFYAVLGVPLSHRYSPVTTTCGSFLMGSIELMLVALLAQIPAIGTVLDAHGLQVFTSVSLIGGYGSLKDILLMLYVSVGVSGAGFACYFMAAEAGSPFTASLAFFFKPVLAPILALLFLGESIHLNMMLGIALILLGSFFAMLEKLRETMLWLVLRTRMMRHHHTAAHFRDPDHPATHFHRPK